MGARDYFVNKMLAAWEESDRKKLAGIPLPDGVIGTSDICYTQSQLRGHMLDIYYPSQTCEKMPVLIDVHGGGFMSSYKELNKLFGYSMARRGFLVFNINYQLAIAGVKITDQISDVRKATTWIYKNLDQYNGNQDQVILCGHSAGAVLATIEALVAQSPRLSKVFDIHEKGIGCYHGLMLDCGMMTFYQQTPNYWGMRKMVFEKGYQHSAYYKNMIWENIPEIASLPKTYLISNERDELKHMTLKFKKIIENKQVPHQLNFETSGALGHMGIIYDPESDECSRVIDEAITFLLGSQKTVGGK